MNAILEPSIKKYEEEGQLSVKRLWVLFFFMWEKYISTICKLQCFKLSAACVQIAYDDMMMCDILYPVELLYGSQ